MTIVLQVPDEKAPALLEVLQSISFVETTTVDNETLLIAELKEAAKELALIKAGRSRGRNVRELLNEL